MVTHKNTVGVNMDITPEFFTYPNPSNGIFIIQSESSEFMEVQVYTLQGSLVFKKSDFTSGGVIDLSNQVAGSYILQMINSKGATGKMIQKL